LPESVVEDAQVVNLGDVGFCIMNDSYMLDQAAEYLKMWAVGDGAKNLLIDGAFPVSAKLYLDDIRNTYPVAVEVITAVCEGSTVVPYTHYMPYYAVVHDGVNKNVERLITTGEIGIDEFIDGIQNKLE
jgi:hypothetical protein